MGGVLGSIAYILIAKLILDHTDMGCYPPIFRSVIEASMFPAWIIVGATIRPESIYYWPAQYGLSSIPYAIVTALFASGLKKAFVLALFILTGGTFCSWVLWMWFMTQMCA